MKLQMAVEQVLPYLRVTKKTRYNYLGAYNRYFSASLGQRCMSEIAHLEIREIISKLPSQSGYQALMVLRSIYREANTQGLCEVNPTTQIKSPQISVKPGRFLTWDQIKDNDFGRYSEHIRFLALHGLRWGEAVALTQDDIYDGLVHINRSIHGATKSPAGIRTVPYLGNFQQFPVTRKPLAKALKPYEVNIHSLRKSYAYILKSNNIHVTTAQRLLGHASPLLTLSVYTQVLDDEIIKAGAVLLNAISIELKPISEKSKSSPVVTTVSLARIVTLSNTLVSVQVGRISEIVAHIATSVGEDAAGISLTAVITGGQGIFSDGSKSMTGLTDALGDVYFRVSSDTVNSESGSLTVTETMLPISSVSRKASMKPPVAELVRL